MNKKDYVYFGKVLYYKNDEIINKNIIWSNI